MVKKCNSMVELPELDGKVSVIKEAQLNSIDEMKRIISGRFSWLSLEEVPFVEFGCVSDEEMEHI